MTKPDKTRHELSNTQLNAIDFLIAGKTNLETAAKVGVARQTVTIWRNHHPAFIAELNARRQALWGANADRLRQLVGSAIDILADDLTSGRFGGLRQPAAVHILRAVGLYGKSLKPEGEITPEAVEQTLITPSSRNPQEEEIPPGETQHIITDVTSSEGQLCLV